MIVNPYDDIYDYFFGGGKISWRFRKNTIKQLISDQKFDSNPLKPFARTCSCPLILFSVPTFSFSWLLPNSVNSLYDKKHVIKNMKDCLIFSKNVNDNEL